MYRLAILILFSYGMLPVSPNPEIDWDFVGLFLLEAMNAITAALYTSLVILIATPAACCCLAFYTYSVGEYDYTVGGYETYPEYKVLVALDVKPVVDMAELVHEVQVGQDNEANQDVQAEQDEQKAEDELELDVQDVMPPTLAAIDRLYPKTVNMTKCDVMDFSVRGLLHVYCHIHGGASNGY